MTRLPIIAALAAAFAAPALAQPAPAGVARTATLAATVESIDQASRQAVLRGEDGAAGHAGACAGGAEPAPGEARRPGDRHL